MLLGRSRELATLALSLRGDRPTVVVGESGVGKTELLRAAAKRDGRRAFEGGALSTLSWLDYQALERAVGRQMSGLDPAAVAAEVEDVVGDGILLVDDLQWATASGLEAVCLNASRVAVLAGVRTGSPAADAALARLSEAEFEIVRLTGLALEDAIALVRQVHPGIGPESAQRIADRAGGNPLLLRELASSGEPSDSMRLAIQARLRGLEPSARQAFVTLALLGRPVAIDALGVDAVRALRAADLALVTEQGQLEIRHALLGEVAIGGLTEDERRELHATIAARIVDDPAEVARHLAQAGDRRAAYLAALAAAERSTRPGERASHLALAAMCAEGPEAHPLLLEAAYALEEAHDWPALTDVLGQLADAPDEIRAAADLVRARASWRAGDPEGLRTAIADGLDLVRGQGTAIEVRLLIEQGRIPIFIDGDADRAVRQTSDAVQLAIDADVDIAHALYLHGTALYIAEDRAAPDVLGRAISLARESGNLSTELLAANNLITYHESSGDPVVGRQIAGEYRMLCRDNGLAVWDRSFRIAESNLDFHLGRYDAVLAAADELLDLPLEVRARDNLTEQLCLALVDTGRIDEAMRRIDAEPARPDDWTWERVRNWVRCEAALWGGQPHLALEFTAAILAGEEDDQNILFAQVSDAWARYDLDKPAVSYALTSSGRMVAAIPHEVDGIAALQSGQPGSAVQHFDRAAEIWAIYHRRGEIRCRWAAGEAARVAGYDDAVDRLLDVERRCEAAELVPMTARVQRSLRAAGVSRSAARRRAHHELLSGRQEEVLRLVAAGLTNAEIAGRLGVSRHTVVTQLTNASLKLGAANRSQAAALLMSVEPS